MAASYDEKVASRDLHDRNISGEAFQETDRQRQTEQTERERESIYVCVCVCV
jgi:hypothetical protein